MKKETPPLWSNLKQEHWESEKYIAWVRKQPSVLTERTPCVAHHIHGHKYQAGSGTGLKPPDYFTFPLTDEEHTILHQHGWARWEAEHGSQWLFVAQTMGRAIQAEVLKI